MWTWQVTDPFRMLDIVSPFAF